MAEGRDHLINETKRDRKPCPGQPQERKDGTRAEDMRVLSALSLVLAFTFLAIFNTFMNHSFPSLTSCPNSTTKDKQLKKLRISYVATSTVGFMILFSAALLSYEFFLLFKEKRIKELTQQRFWMNACYLYVLAGIVCSFVSHAIGLYMVHCDKDNLFLTYIISLSSIFLLTIFGIALLENKFGRSI